MVSMESSSPKPVKRLSELLEEQQEPFHLDVYLLERGYLKKLLNSSKSKSGRNSIEDLKFVGSSGLKRRKKTPFSTNILKTVINKLVLNKGVVKTSACCDNGEVVEATQFTICVKGGKNMDHVSEMGRFSSASSMTVYDSSSESDTENEFPQSQQTQIPSSQPSKLCSFRNQVGGREETEECECLQDSKQHSPVSVLEELPSDEVSPFHDHMRCCSRSSKREIPKRVTEESIFSASLWDLLIGESDKQGNFEYRKTKKVVEQTKQLLFDCVRQVLESNGRNGGLGLGGEEIGKIVCDQIRSWANQSGNVGNITQMINSDLWESVGEWNDFQPQLRKMMGTEISNAIMDEMGSEIVSDMIDCFFQPRQ